MQNSKAVTSQKINLIGPEIRAELGIIGGTGIYDPHLFEDIREVKVSTPYGAPSPSLSVGELNGENVAFVPRHGKDHSIPPHKINYRANIFALNEIGVKRIVAISSVGSLKEALKPGEIVFPDQFIDRTKNRPDTFFEGSLVAHVSSADPMCPEIRKTFSHCSKDLGLEFHDGAVYVCIEGPRFSTRAESRLFRQWGADIIGMTLYPECMLAREMEMCYATIAMVTDYDVWANRPVTAEEVSKVMKRNVENAKKLVISTLGKLPETRACDCGKALAGAVI